MVNVTRKALIIGNWKMYKTMEEALAFVEALTFPKNLEVMTVGLAAPFTALSSLQEKTAEKQILLGAQNMHNAEEGAFTGEIAATMLSELGVYFVLLGHSERRHLFQESSSFIQKKVVAALDHGIRPFLCVGETLVERQEGKREAVLKEQIEVSLQDIKEEHQDKIGIAYEPVWAIGTGKVASLEEIQEAHLFCREVLTAHFSFEVAQKIPILYGGSVNEHNAALILSQKEVDGLLIGAASLSSESFSKIINKCESL
jgi:triosephosphate isomerase (TIM)